MYLFIYLFSFNFFYRLSETAFLIQDNFLLFASVCEHIDVVNSIINYLKYFSVQFMHDTMSTYNNIPINMKIY